MGILVKKLGRLEWHYTVGGLEQVAYLEVSQEPNPNTPLQWPRWDADELREAPDGK